MARLRDRPQLVAAALIGALSLLVVAANLGQPLVRNGLVYARAAGHVAERGFLPFAVVADSRLSYDKPIGFAWLSAPLVEAFGSHVGLMLASCAGTLFFLGAVWRFTAAFDPFGFGKRERALVLWLVFFNPLVVYQLWSAHPDGLFAGLVLACFVLVHRLALEPGVRVARRAVLLALLLVASLLVKNYALILGLGLPLYFGLRCWRAPAGRRPGPRDLVWTAAAFLAFGLFAVLAWLGKNPLERLAGEGGGVGQYGMGSLGVSALGTWLQLGLTLLINLHVALPFAFGAFARGRGPGVAAAFVFVLVYVVGLMPFPTTYYNMRYFLPVLPFVALLAVNGFRRAGPGLQKCAVAVYLLIAGGLVAVFNVAPLHAQAAPFVPTLRYARGYGGLGLLDNLRMALHREEAEKLALVNRSVEPGGLLVMVNCRYYGDALHGVYEAAGQIRPDIRTRYLAGDDWRVEERSFHVWLFYGDPASLERLGVVSPLGPGIYRVEARD